MAGRELADEYAEALAGLIEDADGLEAAVVQVRALADEAVPGRGAALFWRSHRADAETKRSLVAGLLEKVGAADVVRSFMDLLLRNNRVGHLTDIADALEAKAAERAGRAVAVVTSAQPLTDEQEGALRERLEVTSGKKVALRTEVDGSLVGGLRVRLENTIIDGSVRGRLEAFVARFGP
jgi:F-type H+-transporting ATPase subunit delta